MGGVKNKILSKRIKWFHQHPEYNANHPVKIDKCVSSYDKYVSSYDKYVSSYFFSKKNEHIPGIQIKVE